VAKKPTFNANSANAGSPNVPSWTISNVGIAKEHFGGGKVDRTTLRLVASMSGSPQKVLTEFVVTECYF
jgi:hypothetical protein